ncbi:MAG: FAD-dependent monooxygenase [Vicinamibacterales bacterium]
MGESRLRSGHAVVLGGSMAGLLAARVLADHFRSVTLVERDELPTETANRRGVPQGRHTHGLLASGRDTLEQLFPGFSDDLVAQGAIAVDVLADARWFFEGAPLARPITEMKGLMSTRPFLEANVRARVRALPNVDVRTGCQAMSLVADERGTRVTGVRVQNGTSIDADLVVDATGRGSRAPQWLRTMGYQAPDEERVEIGVSYCTRFFKREPHHLNGDFAAIAPPTPDGKRGGVMLAQEGDRWTVTLIAHFVEGAGEDLESFRAFAAMLPSMDIHDVVNEAEPIGDAVRSKFPASVRCRYERLTVWPEGFVVMGDAICSFNPIYGQGMSVSALEALALGEVLAAGTQKVARRFFKRAARIVDGPWTTAVGNDLRMPEAVGPRSVIGNVINAYVARLHRVAQTDGELARRFMRVANLLDEPPALFAPSTVWRVLRPGRLRLAQERPSVQGAAPRTGRTQVGQVG